MDYRQHTYLKIGAAGLICVTLLEPHQALDLLAPGVWSSRALEATLPDHGPDKASEDGTLRMRRAVFTTTGEDVVAYGPWRISSPDRNV